MNYEAELKKATEEINYMNAENERLIGQIQALQDENRMITLDHIKLQERYDKIVAAVVYKFLDIDISGADE